MRIDMDTCEEILVTITRNKTRSLLTAFGVFWGIFMLVALIGGGQGMQEQMKAQFEGFATNSGFIAAQKTSEAYKGFRKGRWWDLEMEDVERVRSIDGIKTATPSFALWGQTAVYGENISDFYHFDYGYCFNLKKNQDLFSEVIDKKSFITSLFSVTSRVTSVQIEETKRRREVLLQVKQGVIPQIYEINIWNNKQLEQAIKEKLFINKTRKLNNNLNIVECRT